MIFLTQNQFVCFLIFLFFGILSYIIISLFSLIFLKKFQKYFINSLFNMIFCAFFIIFFEFLLIIFNFGIFSFTLLFSFFVGHLWSKKLFEKLFVFLENKWYNIINTNKTNRKNKSEFKSNKN